MTPLSNNNNDQRPPTGNLEELFRQKLGEAELTPRADMWDRLDHELLLRENQGYRRRLVGYRRAAAAAVAVATLGVGGWLTQRTLAPTAPSEVAVLDTDAVSRSAAGRLGQAAHRSAANTRVAANTTAAPTADGQLAAEAPGRPTTRPGASTAAAEAGQLLADNGLATAESATARAADNLRDAFGARRRTAAPVAQPGLLNRAVAAIRQTFGGSGAASGAPGPQLPANRIAAPNGGAGVALAATTGSTSAAGAGAARSAATAADEAAMLPFIASRLHRTSLGHGLPDSLKPSLLSTPALLAAQQAADEEAEEKKMAGTSRWRWRGSYAAQRFEPNVSSAVGGGIAFSAMPTFSPSPSASRGAVTEEPIRLQPGVAQRGQLGVALPLGKKHWTLLTGVELASITGRTGREVPQPLTSNGTSANKFQTGRYAFTTAGVPVQVRYESRKQGWGVYAAVGAAVNVLLRNRTTVSNQVTTDDASYRRVLMAARGSAGVRFAPKGSHWQLNVGPEAEAGLSTLNANPSGTWTQRTRPYTVGLAASVEFGGGKVELAP